MSDIKLTFDPKSTSKYAKTAKKLARKLNAYKSEKDKSLLVVEIKKADIDKDFRSLFNHVINTGGTTIELDDEIVEDTFQFRHVINCRYLNSDTHCYGICRMMNSELDRVFGAIGILGHERKHRSFHPDNGLNNAEYIIDKDEEIFIDKHKLYERFIDDTELQGKICQKYNLELVKEKFSELANLTPVTFTDEKTEDSEVEEEYDVGGIKEEYEKDSNDLNEDIITKIGDEFEKRLRKVLDEYFKEEK